MVPTLREHTFKVAGEVEMRVGRWEPAERRSCWTLGALVGWVTALLCSHHLQEAGAALLPRLRCRALYRPPHEDLHPRAQGADQEALVLPVQAQVGTCPPCHAFPGRFGEMLDRFGQC